MTSKEKLNKLLDMQCSLGLNPPSCLDQSHLYKELYNDLIQTLERLEKENQELRKSNIEIEKLYLNENKHWCETIDSLRKENEKLKNENQILNQSVKDTYDTSQEIIYELTQEIEKLKKAIEILKPAITLGCGWYQYYITFMKSVSCDITEQEYELLKEVLGE